MNDVQNSQFLEPKIEILDFFVKNWQQDFYTAQNFSFSFFKVEKLWIFVDIYKMDISLSSRRTAS